MFRLEGELGYKHASVKHYDFANSYLTGISAGSGGSFTSGDQLGFSRKMSILSAMVNGMLDIGDSAGWSGFAGGGVG